MDKALIIVLFLASTCSAQTVQQVIINAGAPSQVVVTGGWTWLQSTCANGGGTQFQTCQAPAVCQSGTACSFPLTAVTTIHSDLAVGLENLNNQTLKIASAYSCVSSSPCLSTSGDLVDTFSLCAASACFVQNGTHDEVDAAYATNSGGGAGVITVNLSGTSSNYANTYDYFQEILPPSCNGSVCGSAFDNNATSFGTGCNTGGGCTGSSMSITATDGMIAFLDTGTTQTAQAAAYQVEQTGNVFGIDLTSIPTFTIQLTLSSYYTLTAIAFKSTGAAYTPVTPTFTPVNLSLTNIGNTLGFGRNLTCSPTCNFGPGASSSGDLIYVQAIGPVAGTQVISSISGRGTWVVPTACKDTSIQPISCAYVLSSTGGGAAISITMSGNCSCSFSYWEASKATSITLDYMAKATSVGTTTLTGPTPTLAGSVDACFYEFGYTPGTTLLTIGTTLYPYPGGANTFPGFNNTGPYGAALGLFNATNTNPPKIKMSGTGATTSVASVACFE